MIIGSQVFHKKNSKNTFDWAKENVDSVSDGAVFIADYIEHAKGRQGRTWQCYSGQLLLTILLKPNSSKISVGENQNQLMMAFCVAFIRVLKKYEVGLKWPNDFVIGDKKVGGIIGEIIWEGANPKAVIIGFGLNVNNTFLKSDDLYTIATSLKEITKENIDIKKLQNELLSQADVLYKDWLNGKNQKIFEEWKEFQIYKYKKMVIHKSAGNIVFGVVKDFYENGDLLLDDDKGCGYRIEFEQVLEVKGEISTPLQ